MDLKRDAGDAPATGEHSQVLRGVVCLTATCESFGHKRQAVARTWRQDWVARGGRHFFVLGDPTLEHAVLLDDCFYVPCRDDYESLLLKLSLAYRFVHQSHWDFSHVLKLDDDCYLDVERFEGLLADANLAAPDRDYLGAAIQPCAERINPRWHFGKCSDPRFDTAYPHEQAPADYAKGGYGYLLSRRALGVISGLCDMFRSELQAFRYSFEDLRIGEILASEGMPAQLLPGVTLSPPTKALGHDAVLVYDLGNPALFDARHAEVCLERSRAQGHRAADLSRVPAPARPAGFDSIYLFYEASVSPLPALLELADHDLHAFPLVYADAGPGLTEGAGSTPATATASLVLAVLAHARSHRQQRVLLLDASLRADKDLRVRLADLWSSVDPRSPLLCLGTGLEWPTAAASAPAALAGVPRLRQVALVVHASAFDRLERRIHERAGAADTQIEDLSGLALLLSEWPEPCLLPSRSLWQGPAAAARPAVAVVLGAGVPDPQGDASRHGIDLLVFRSGPDGLRPSHRPPDGFQVEALPEHRPIDHLRHSLARQALLLKRPASADEIVAHLSWQLTRPSEAALAGSAKVQQLPSIRGPLRTGRASVVVPTKGRREPLELALRSVLEQDWPDLELLLVNENPPDSEMTRWVRALVKTLSAEHPSRRVVLLQHAVPRNAAAARNTGLLAASGEFVSFLDDDDAYLPGRLSKVISALQRQPQVQAMYCGYLGWISKENNLARYPTDDMVWRLLALDFHSHYVCTDTVTYRTECLLAINGYDEGFVRHQDLELNVRFLSRFSIGAHPEALVQLNPLPADQANKVFDEVFFRLKQRFLAKFAGEIDALGERAPAVFERHAKELRNFCREPGLYERLALQHPSRLSSELLRSALAALPRPSGA